MNKKLLTAVVGATLAVAGNAANAIDLKISGHLARGVMWADDGITSEIYHVDITPSPSRIRFLASDDLMPGVRAGVTWENGFNSNLTGTVTQTARSAAASLSERWQEIWFSGAFGKIGFGQGEGAAKDTVNSDLSGTNLGESGAPADVGGSLNFRTPGAGTAIVALKNVLNNYDSAGARYDRVRYDSPAIGPVVISASSGYYDSVDVSEFGAKLNLDLGGGGKLAAGLGYTKANTAGLSALSLLAENTGNQESIQFSASWLAPFGLNVTFAHSQREDDATLDGDFNRLKVGYIAGDHAVSLAYAIGKDQVVTDDEAKQISLSYNYKPKPWADIFASAKTVSLDRTGVDAEDLLIVLVGSRIVF